MDRKKIAIDFAKSLNHPEIEKIILFGSVARGDDTQESDIDILIITKNEDDEFKIEDDVYEKAWDICLDTMVYISVKMRSIEQYETYKDFPFYSNVEKDGVLIGNSCNYNSIPWTNIS